MDAKLAQGADKHPRSIFLPVVGMEDDGARMMRHGAEERLADKHSPMPCLHSHAHNFSCDHIHHCREIEEFPSIRDIREVRDPHVMRMTGHNRLQEVGIVSSRIALFSWPSPAPPICLEAEELHDAGDGFAVSPERKRDTRRSICRMLRHHHLDLVLQCPIFGQLLGYVIQA